MTATSSRPRTCAKTTVSAPSGRPAARAADRTRAARLHACPCPRAAHRRSPTVARAELEWDGEDYTDVEAIIIAAFLKDNKELTRLDLARNSIADAGAIALAAALRENTKLEYLNLESNVVAEKGEPAPVPHGPLSRRVQPSPSLGACRHVPCTRSAMDDH